MSTPVTLRRYTQLNGWEEIYPKTEIDQIIGLTTAGKNILLTTTPASGQFGMIRVDDEGRVDQLTPTALRTAIEASHETHYHELSDVSQNGTPLSTILANKANLQNGVIHPDHIPTYLFGGLKYYQVWTGSTLSLDSYETTIAADDEFYDKKGLYTIMSGEVTVSFSAGQTVTSSDEGGDSSGTIILEPGDWLVHVDTNVWNVVNNTYRVATINTNGIVSMSAATATQRGQLSSSSTNRHLNVMDEAAVRKVIKNISYSALTPSNPVEGDLWFEGSF